MQHADDALRRLLARDPLDRLDHHMAGAILGGVAGVVLDIPDQQGGFALRLRLDRLDQLGPASDIYSLGAILYHMLTGKYTYDFPAGQLIGLVKILEEDPVPIRSRRADLPARLAEIIERCLAREPKDRFPDAESLREALVPFLKPPG